MVEWAELTVCGDPFLDEIVAALRDASIEVQLSDPVGAAYGGSTPGRSTHSRFGQRVATNKVIWVPRSALDRAQSTLREIFEGAEEAAVRESGASPASEPDEPDEEDG
jgi:hypothetical protein